MRRDQPELRYLDQVVDVFDPDMGLMLPEQLAALVSLELLPKFKEVDDPGALWRRSLTALLRDPAAPRLRTLILADWSDHAPDPCDIAFESGDAAPLLRRNGAVLNALERLHIGRFPLQDPPGEGFCQGIGGAISTLPALVRLHLLGERGWELLPSAGHPRLRELILHVAEPDDDVLAVLLSAPFPALASLDLWCGSEIAEALADGSFAAGLLEFSALRQLTLRGLGGAEALAGLAACDSLAPGLHTLALADAPAFDDDALAPLLSAAWLPRLGLLDLRGTTVSTALADQLRARGPNLAR